MAYGGDGSFKGYGFNKEESLIDFITAEDEAVDAYNDAVIAYNKAKQNCMNTVKYEERIKETKAKMNESRRKLSEHLSKYFGIKSDLVVQSNDKWGD